MTKVTQFRICKNCNLHIIMPNFLPVHLSLRSVMSCVSMVVADGCPVFLWGLISVLNAEHDFDVVARCCNGFESLKAIRDLSPDIALLDSTMLIASGVDVLASVISEGSQT